METNKYAYLTLLTTDNYIYYILGLAQSLRDVGAKYPLYCCITKNLSSNTKQVLKDFNINTIELDDNDALFAKIIAGNNKLGVRPN